MFFAFYGGQAKHIHANTTSAPCMVKKIKTELRLDKVIRCTAIYTSRLKSTHATQRVVDYVVVNQIEHGAVCEEVEKINVVPATIGSITL